MSQTNDHMFTLLQIHILCAPKAVFWSLDFYFIVFFNGSKSHFLNVYEEKVGKINKYAFN